jgi:pimeloyl-ACP methyl ester carboxylesterase
MRIIRASLIGAVLAASASLAAQQPAHKFMTASDGVKIHFMEMGSGTPVVLIHGYTANAEGKWFKPGIAQALAKGHRVVAIDARGHGQSDKPHDPLKYGPRMAQDVVELMDHLKIDRAHVHGYSMGGSILTQVLAKHPERVITAIYGGSGVAETDPAWQAQVPKDPEPPAANAPNAPAGETWSRYPGYDRTALDAVQKYPWKPEDRAIDLTKVSIPVLALVGSLDRPNQRTHRLKRELKNFQLVVLTGETHGSAHLNPHYTQTLLKFIEAH